MGRGAKIKDGEKRNASVTVARPSRLVSMFFRIIETKGKLGVIDENGERDWKY